MMISKVSVDGGWCVLRTNGRCTLDLVGSLNGAGIEAWTPVGTSMRRQGRNRAQVKVPCPILPTFVFARYRHVAELLACRSMPTSPHPSFSLFRYNGNIPRISDISLDAIRIEERRHTPRSFPKGAIVTIPGGAWGGMSGTIERVEGKMLLVLFKGFGGVVEVKLDPCELPDDAIERNEYKDGNAARAA